MFVFILSTLSADPGRLVEAGRAGPLGIKSLAYPLCVWIGGKLFNLSVSQFLYFIFFFPQTRFFFCVALAILELAL